METTILAALISILGVLVSLVVSVIIAIRNMNNQNKLSYLQSILQNADYRVRLKYLISTAQFLASLERVFSTVDLSQDIIKSVNTNRINNMDVLKIWIYTRERVWRIKNKRKDKSDTLEKYIEYLVNHEWSYKWRLSKDFKNDFFSTLLGEDEESINLRTHFIDFCNYTRNFMLYSVLESNFILIFATAPHHKNNLFKLINYMAVDNNYNEWQQFEEIIIEFLSGKNWIK